MEPKDKKLKAVRTRNCNLCGAEYEKTPGLAQWAKSKYCTRKCALSVKRTAKKTIYAQDMPEWKNRISVKTMNVLLKPESNLDPKEDRLSGSALQAIIQKSNASSIKLPKNAMFGSNAYPNVQRGDYENSKGTMYFRSKWEANYALYLDFLVKTNQIKNWEYEVDVFVFESIMFGTRSYRPDFKIFNNDGTIEYHEVKGYMDGRSKTKLKRMAKYYPEVKLILIEKDSYRDIKKQLGSRLGFY